MGYIESLMGRNERIQYQTRQHWIRLLPRLVADLLIAGAILFLGTFAGVVTAGPGALLYLLLIIPAAHFLGLFLDWWNEQYLITNRRVIQVEGVINKHVIDSSLEKVNDVVLVQSAAGRLLGYGNIEILTGSEIGVNLLERIYQPVTFKTAMLNAKEGLSQLDAFEDRARVIAAEPTPGGDVPELITELDELRRNGLISQEEFESKKKELLSRI
jgi:uncharacterized membrane protein YdbT with pleckstrin-like domain